MSTSQLSQKVQELIHKARIVSFSTWHDSHPAEAIQCFQAADDQGRYLTDDDFKQIHQLAPETTGLMGVAQQLRDRVSDIVADARSEVLQTFPNITQPGGELYPATRSDACWRDFWQFLRCISYGIAGQHIDYTSSEGLGYLQLLYQELQVPLDAMVVGLEGMKTASLKRVDPEQQPILAPYFDHLIEELKAFE